MSSSFVITNIGLDKAAQANGQGISLTIKKFAIGDAYDYTPSVSDMKLHGNSLYEAAPTSYKYVGNRTLQIMCTLPDTVGPFAWGEIGLYLDTGELFALASLPKLQNKYSSLESDIASSVTFYCYITLAYDTVQVTIDYGDSGNPTSTVEILDVYKWSTVRKPSEVPLGISEMIVHELSPLNNTTLLLKDDDDRWTVASTYEPLFNNAVPAASTNTYLEYEIVKNNLSTALASTTKNLYIAQFPDGSFSSFSKVELVNSNSRLRFTYTDALDTARDLDANVLFFKATGPQSLVADLIDIATETTGDLNYNRLTGDAVIKTAPASNSNDLHIAPTSWVNARIAEHTALNSAPAASADGLQIATAGWVNDRIDKLNGSVQPTLTALVNWTAMSNEVGGAVVKNLNNGTYGISAYGGDNKGSLGQGDIILTRSYESYDALLVYGCNDSATLTYVAYWPMWQFKFLMNKQAQFSITSSGGFPASCNWYIKTLNFYNTPSTTTRLRVGPGGQNCGIIEIYGVTY